MKSVLLLAGLCALGYFGFHGVKGDFWDKPLFAKAEPAATPAAVFVQPIPMVAAPVEAPAPAPYVNPLDKGAYNRNVAVPNPGAINYNKQTVIVVQQPVIVRNIQQPIVKRPGVMTKEVMKEIEKRPGPLVQSQK